MAADRSSHRRCPVRKVFLEISKNSQEENTCTRVSFFNKFAGATCNFIKKGDSGTGIFLWILRNFWEPPFYKTPLGDCFWSESNLTIQPQNASQQHIYIKDFDIDHYDYCCHSRKSAIPLKRKSIQSHLLKHELQRESQAGVTIQ